MEYITYREAANLLSMKEGTIRAAAAKGTLTKVPTTSIRQLVIKEQVLLFKNKKQIRETMLSNDEKAAWNKYKEMAENKRNEIKIEDRSPEEYGVLQFPGQYVFVDDTGKEYAGFKNENGLVTLNLSIPDEEAKKHHENRIEEWPKGLADALTRALKFDVPEKTDKDVIENFIKILSKEIVEEDPFALVIIRACMPNILNEDFSRKSNAIMDMVNFITDCMSKYSSLHKDELSRKLRFLMTEDPEWVKIILLYSTWILLSMQLLAKYECQKNLDQHQAKYKNQRQVNQVVSPEKFVKELLNDSRERELSPSTNGMVERNITVDNHPLSLLISKIIEREEV